MTIYENVELLDTLIKGESEKDNPDTKKIRELVEAKATLLDREAAANKADEDLRTAVRADEAKEKSEKKTFWLEVGKLVVEVGIFAVGIWSKRDLFERVEIFEKDGRWTSSGGKELIKREIV